jgi:NAD(P)-dependent dehydrogenase (short-subunit alcohol dehydrogenase family)
VTEERKVALVTGASGGIGSATATALAKSGYIVLGADIDAAAGRLAFAEFPHPSRFLELDVTDEAQWRRVVASVATEFGRLDLLHLNAGVMTRPRGVPLFDDTLSWLTVDSWKRVRSVNLDGVVFGVLAALEAPGLRHVIITASGAAILPLEMDPYYTATKFGELGLGLALAPLLQGRGVRLDIICPGAIETGLTAPDVRAAIQQEPASFVAECVLRLASGEAGGPIWLAFNSEAGLQSYELPGLPGMTAALDVTEKLANECTQNDRA